MNLRPSLSVQSKLVVAFALLTSLAIALVSAIGYINARTSLRAAAERQLIGLHRTKVTLIRTMLTSTRNEILTVSASDLAATAANEMLAAYRQLDKLPVTPAMQETVREFYASEFEPALAGNMAGTPVAGAFLPTTPAGWYLHYHYFAMGERPYGPRRLLSSTTDSSVFGAALARQQRLLGPTIERLGFENILLVDPVTLDVFFSYEQSTIAGTNLQSGPYASGAVAALAGALRTTQEEDDYRVSDFEAYRPALGQPKGFIATPVFDGPRMVAIMVLRFPIEPLTSALSNDRGWEAEGLGKTGEVYLLGPDRTMRSDSRFLIEDRKAFIESLRRSQLTSRTVDDVSRLNTTILTLPVRHEAARAALNGQTGIMELDDYRGVPALIAYGPVDLDSLRWGVIAKIDKAEALAPLNTLVRRMVATGVALALLSSLLALAFASLLTRPIAALVRGARRVSEGKLDVEVDVVPQDEFRELGEAFNDMVRSLRASRAALDHQVRENERLLVSLLPASAAAQVREGTAEAPRSFADVTVAYGSLSGFGSLSPHLGEDQSMSLLSEIVAAFDEAAEHYGVEKVRTIGSSYLAASGLSVDRPDHTARMVDFAREIVRIVRRFNTERQATLSIKIGINTGPVVGGLVGRRKFIYDLWGDTVKLAKNIEGNGHHGKTSILVTKAVYDRVRDLVVFEPAKKTELRGGEMIDLYPIAEEVG